MWQATERFCRTRRSTQGLKGAVFVERCNRGEWRAFPLQVRRLISSAVSSEYDYLCAFLLRHRFAFQAVPRCLPHLVLGELGVFRLNFRNSPCQVILRRSLDSVKSGGQNKAAPRPLSKAVKTPAGPRPLVTQSASKQRRVGHLSIRQNSSNLSPRSAPYYPPMATI